MRQNNRLRKAFHPTEEDSNCDAEVLQRLFTGVIRMESRQSQPPQINDEEESGQPGAQTEAEKETERRNLRRLQLMMDMVLSVISQDPDLTRVEAMEMVASCKNAALAMFPDKELAFDLIYRPRLQRVINERFRVQ